MMTWRADLELSYLDEFGNEGGAPDVVGGYAEFLVINVGQHPIADLLDSLGEDAADFAVLFEDEEVSPPVEEQFTDATVNRVLIVALVEVAEPLRGNALASIRGLTDSVRTFRFWSWIILLWAAVSCWSAQLFLWCPRVGPCGGGQDVTACGGGRPIVLCHSASQCRPGPVGG